MNVTEMTEDSFWQFRTISLTRFRELDVFPFKEIGAELACPRGVSKMATE